jgi:PadR family transcriptional regulator PadR
MRPFAVCPCDRVRGHKKGIAAKTLERLNGLKNKGDGNPMARQATAVKDTTNPGMKVIEPAILILLQEKPSHGYELLRRMADLDPARETPDTGAVYRALRVMETQGLVKSKWLTECAGPAKRCYEVTEKAREVADDWLQDIELEIQRLGHYVDRLRQF